MDPCASSYFFFLLLLFYPLSFPRPGPLSQVVRCPVAVVGCWLLVVGSFDLGRRREGRRSVVDSGCCWKLLLHTTPAASCEGAVAVSQVQVSMGATRVLATLKSLAVGMGRSKKSAVSLTAFSGSSLCMVWVVVAVLCHAMNTMPRSWTTRKVGHTLVFTNRRLGRWQ
ncbi:MAG: hypothetical protein J3Q66DRAFT_330363 [Benniella sp.]|nr:MAG: hypothetical protein J3Q66DRAFT_330363 [Benniella sp.]